MGVLVHEMVHCFQYNAKGTCPGGLVEGIAGMIISMICIHWSVFSQIGDLQILYVCGPPLTLHTGSAACHPAMTSGMLDMNVPHFSLTGLRYEIA